MLAGRFVVFVLAASGLLAGSAGSASGATPCGSQGVLSTTATGGSCQYTTVGEDSFSIPAGVTSVSVVAVGAPGGNGGLLNSTSADGAAGGLGAVVTAPAVSVAGLTKLYVEVGGPGGHGLGMYSGTDTCPGGTAGAGGGGAGGNARCDRGSGGGGGGESDVRTQLASAGGLTGSTGDPRLVVAGGGGGGGGEVYTAGGAGGSSGGSAAGGAGAGASVDCRTYEPGVAGTGETGSGGGAAGLILNPSVCILSTSAGFSGTATSGGAGGDGDAANFTGPGGGGGGYVGGGGGSAVEGADAPGGGGGSSYAPADAGATFATAPSAATPAAVTISWGSPAKPTALAAPAISGTVLAGGALSCSAGTWANQPTAFAYQWNRNGTPLVGATSSTYTVASLDEGTTLTCTVTASNASASTSMTSAGVIVPVPYVPHCPGATGSLSAGQLGTIRLGMARAQARHAYRHSSDRGKRYEDFFCLTPIGIRVGYASPKLEAVLPVSARASVRGRVVWASTANPRYAIRGVRPGALLKAASLRLRVGKVLPIGRNDWYLAPAGSVTAVLKVRHGVVEEIGIAERALTHTREQQRTFMRSFE